MDDDALSALPPGMAARLRSLLAAGGRRLLGLTGPPGAGKSTLAERLSGVLGPRAQVVPMDGFHLAATELQRLGLSHCKGAPDTFDAAGYLALLRRLRSQGADETVYAPEYRRALKEPVAGAIAVLPGTPLVITEGNYLLLQQGPWQEVAGLLDEVWYLDVDDALRRQRLVERHRFFGRSLEDAQAWVRDTDEPNARLIAGQRGRAQVWLRNDGSG